MAIFEPESFEAEEQLTIPTPPGADCIALSGYASFSQFAVNRLGGPTPSKLKGDPENDSIWVAHEAHMVVGPKWRAVRDVSPVVALAGYSFQDSDEADDSGCQIDTCTWDTVGEVINQVDFLRIRLKVNLRMCGGEGFSVTKLSYHLVAVGIF